LIAVSNADLRFSLVLVKTVYAAEETTRPREFDRHRSKSIHVDDGVTVTSLSANIKYKKIAAR